MTRAISVIAQEVVDEWRDKTGASKINYAAVPYLQAMLALDKITDKYGYDDAIMVVLYFLSNATSWRGEAARRIKAELNAMCKAA